MAAIEPSAHRDLDLLVIGAGAAGSTVAFEAAAKGARVALAERWKVGGTCLNAGCDPTKTLVRSAEVLHLARTAERFGISVPAAAADWPAVRARVAGVIDAIRGGDGDCNVRDAGIDLVKAHARFHSPHEIEADGRLLRAEKVVVAVGARAMVPEVPGLREAGFVTNVEAVDLPDLPRRLAVVGGGVVAVEFAQIFARFGVEVTLLARGPLLRGEEPELVAALTEALRREGVRIETGVRPERVERLGGTKLLRGRRGPELIVCEADEILLATGRVPALEDLGLDAAGIAHSAQGIVVDAGMKSSQPHVWAVGDAVAGGLPFTHVADYQARVVVHNALSDERPQEAVYDGVPWAIFTDPELGHVGHTEADARAAGFEVKTAVVPIRGLARAVTSDEPDGMVKLVAERTTGRLLGGHVLSARGGELLGEIALAVRLKLSAEAIAHTLHAYPTFSEGVFWTAFELAKPDGG